MSDNYYSILGITDDERKLTGEEFAKILKKKYYKLSKEYHPDTQTGKTDEEKEKAGEMFAKISEAYETLSDPEKRCVYDNPDFYTEFGGLGDMMGAMREMYNHYHNERQRGANIRINLETTLNDAYTGVRKTIKYYYNGVCKKCGCTGIDQSAEAETCHACSGTGRVSTSRPGMNFIATCPNCGGAGKLYRPCQECNGDGMVKKEETVEINIPQGCAHGYAMAVRNKGCESQNGGERGDLLVVVVVAKDTVCSDGSVVSRVADDSLDLSTKINVTLVELLCGCSKKVELPDGKTIEFKIKECTNPASVLRANGKGLRAPNGITGNLLVGLTVEMPKSIGEDTRKKIAELKQELYG